MAVANFAVGPEDGWVQITTGPTDFIRITQYPENVPFYVATGSSTPAASFRGFRCLCEDFWSNNIETDNFYVKVINPIPGGPKLLIDVYYNPHS